MTIENKLETIEGARELFDNLYIGAYASNNTLKLKEMEIIEFLLTHCEYMHNDKEFQVTPDELEKFSIHLETLEQNQELFNDNLVVNFMIMHCIEAIAFNITTHMPPEQWTSTIISKSQILEISDKSLYFYFEYIKAIITGYIRTSYKVN